VVSTNSEAEGLDPFLMQLDRARLSPLIEAGMVSQAEADELAGQQAGFLAGDPFVMFLSLVVGGHKPEER
jgi:hypothetical protein